jgi:hypothetical protein
MLQEMASIEMRAKYLNSHIALLDCWLLSLFVTEFEAVDLKLHFIHV